MSYTAENSVRFEGGKTFIIKERMQNIVDVSDRSVEVIENKIESTSRWSIDYEIIFELGGKYYRSYYSRGATELQGELPYEHDDDWVEVEEVVPKEVTVIQYVPKGVAE